MKAIARRSAPAPDRGGAAPVERGSDRSDRVAAATRPRHQQQPAQPSRPRPPDDHTVHPRRRLRRPFSTSSRPRQFTVPVRSSPGCITTRDRDREPRTARGRRARRVDMRIARRCARCSCTCATTPATPANIAATSAQRWPSQPGFGPGSGRRVTKVTAIGTPMLMGTWPPPSDPAAAALNPRRIDHRRDDDHCRDEMSCAASWTSAADGAGHLDEAEHLRGCNSRAALQPCPVRTVPSRTQRRRAAVRGHEDRERCHERGKVAGAGRYPELCSAHTSARPPTPAPPARSETWHYSSARSIITSWPNRPSPSTSASAVSSPRISSSGLRRGSGARGRRNRGRPATVLGPACTSRSMTSEPVSRRPTSWSSRHDRATEPYGSSCPPPATLPDIAPQAPRLRAAERTRAHIRYLWARREPRLYAARHVMVATAEVVAGLLLARIPLGFVPRPRLGLAPRLAPPAPPPRPSLPDLPWPASTCRTRSMPDWLAALLASKKVWFPILRRDRRRRRRGERADAARGARTLTGRRKMQQSPRPSTPRSMPPDGSRSSTQASTCFAAHG